MLAEDILTRDAGKTQTTREGDRAPVQVQHEATGGFVESLLKIVVPLEQHPHRLLAWGEGEL